jgi:adenylate cyclase
MMIYHSFMSAKQEIERKFLIKGPFRHEAVDQVEIVQGYLSTDPHCTIRIRLERGIGILTIKGNSDPLGLSRLEWSHEIPLDEANLLFGLCKNHPVSKIRYLIPKGRHLFEVDEFLEINQGLILAEIELNSPDEPFEKPEWLGEEVTGDSRYYNAYLSEHPFTSWQSAS